MLTYDVPTIMCYEHADTFMNKVAPIRDQGGIRPLGQRRYWKDRWVKFNNDVVKHTIVVGNYNAPCVSFYPDNRIEFSHGVYQLTTRQIINAMFRPRFRCVYAHNSKWYLRDMVKQIQYPITRGDSLVLHYTKTEQGVDYVFKGELPTEQKPYVIKEVYAPILKQYKEFLKYVEIMNKLAGGAYERDGFLKDIVNKVDNSEIDSLLTSVANHTMESAPEEFASAFDALLCKCARIKYYSRGEYICTTQSMKKFMYEWIKTKHSDAIYEMRDVPNLTIVR
jgi:hypothetical protein